MKKLNLKKHVAIALAVLSTNSSLSVFAGGEKPDSTAIAPSNSNVVPTLFNQHDISQHLELCKLGFLWKLEGQCLKRGIKFRFIEDLSQLPYPKVKKAFEETAMIINTINISTLNNAIEKLECTLIQELPADIADTIVSAVKGLLMLARNTHNLNNIETQKMFYQYFDVLKGLTLCACHSVGTANSIEEISKAWKVCDRAWSAYKKAGEECEKAEEKCEKAWEVYDRAWSAYKEAEEKCKKAWEVYDRAWSAYKEAEEKCKKAGEECDRALEVYDRAWEECKKAGEECNRAGEECNRAEEVYARAWEECKKAGEEYNKVWKGLQKTL